MKLRGYFKQDDRFYIPLTLDQGALVDERDAVWLSRWAWYACARKGGGSFDWFYHDFYLSEEGHTPMHRSRHGIGKFGKRAEVVVMPCVPEDDRIRRAFRSYMKQTPMQRRLAL